MYFLEGLFGYTNPEGDWRGLNPLLVIFDLEGIESPPILFWIGVTEHALTPLVWLRNIKYLPI
jgi:hypothetical protein